MSISLRSHKPQICRSFYKLLLGGHEEIDPADTKVLTWSLSPSMITKVVIHSFCLIYRFCGKWGLRCFNQHSWRFRKKSGCTLRNDASFPIVLLTTFLELMAFQTHQLWPWLIGLPGGRYATCLRSRSRELRHPRLRIGWLTLNQSHRRTASLTEWLSIFVATCHRFGSPTMSNLNAWHHPRRLQSMVFCWRICFVAHGR